MEPRRVWVQAAAVTAVTALALGGLVTALLQLGPETAAQGGAGLVRRWGLWSALSAPVAFVFGGVAFAIGRSVWRGRRRG